MFWNISSIILGIIGIIVNIVCWRFAFSNVNKYNKYIKKIKEIDFSDPKAFTKITNLCKKLCEIEDKEAKKDISSFSKLPTEEGKINSQDIKTAMYNMTRNSYNNKE